MTEQKALCALVLTTNCVLVPSLRQGKQDVYSLSHHWEGLSITGSSDGTEFGIYYQSRTYYNLLVANHASISMIRMLPEIADCFL
jgi:hypothetical protein